MQRKTWWTAAVALTAVIGIGGCGGEGETAGDVEIAAPPEAVDVTPATPDAIDDDATPAEVGETSAVEVKLSEDEIAQIEKLPAEEQVLALAQKVCPSSDEPLGSMGEPIKVSVGGKTIFACCKGCEEDIQTNFESYITKLGVE